MRLGKPKRTDHSNYNHREDVKQKDAEEYHFDHSRHRPRRVSCLSSRDTQTFCATICEACRNKHSRKAAKATHKRCARNAPVVEPNGVVLWIQANVKCKAQNDKRYDRGDLEER